MAVRRSARVSLARRVIASAWGTEDNGNDK
jgi:hypothetical protein